MPQIATFEELQHACEGLHDCPFDFELAVFDQSTAEWHGTFLRPSWDNAQAEHRRRAFIIHEIRLPVLEALLRVRHVEAVRVLADQGIGTYTFNRVERTSGGLCLAFNEDMRVELSLGGSLEAIYEERPRPSLRARYREMLIFQTGPHIETIPEGPSSGAA